LKLKFVKKHSCKREACFEVSKLIFKKKVNKQAQLHN
jgi:hypothetical protein